MHYKTSFVYSMFLYTGSVCIFKKHLQGKILLGGIAVCFPYKFVYHTLYSIHAYTNKFVMTQEHYFPFDISTCIDNFRKSS